MSFAILTSILHKLWQKRELRMYMYMYNMYEDRKIAKRATKTSPKKHQKLLILLQNYPNFVAKFTDFFTKISAIFPRKIVYVIWWPYIPNMVPTFMAGTKWFRGCSKLMSGRRATWVAPKVSEFDSGGADHLKFDIRVHHLRVIVWHQLSTNLGTRNQMVPALYWAY